MSYDDIFILGWYANVFILIINMVLSFNTIGKLDIMDLDKQSGVLEELKEEFEKYYPTRKYETFISYFIPFTAFFRVSFSIFEMQMFLIKNKDTQLFDFIVYKYERDINLAKNRR